jgi:hypothetical protein
MDMRKYIYILAAAFIALTGCEKDPEHNCVVCGQWRGDALSAEVGIYIDFLCDGTFELYQKMDNNAFELRRGKWNLEGEILSGAYNDGETWSTSYKTTVSGEVLTLVAQDEGSETNSYKKCEIPAGVKENCEVVVKSRD